MEKFTNREEMLDCIINDAETTIGSWQDERIQQVVNDEGYAESLISDWYASKYELTSDEITAIAEMVIYFFDDEQTV